jgi:hypothetical protein
MKTRTLVLGACVSLLAATSAHAEKLKGYIWEASPSSIVVEGQTVRLGPETKIVRQNHKDITAKDLRIGWEVEVDTRGDEANPVAREVKVKQARFQEESFEGVIDRIEAKAFFVDGDEVRLPKGQPLPAGMKLGMRFKGKGIWLDDRTLELKEGQVLGAGFESEEAQFMAAAAQEVAQVKRQLKKINDPELQAYVDRVGRSLVPKWVDPQMFQFTC